MVVAVVEVVAWHRLNIGFSATHHSHHPRLEKRNYLQLRRSREEHLVRRPPPGVRLGSGAVEAVGGPEHGLQPQAVAVVADVGDVGEVDTGEQTPDLAASRVAALHGSPDCTLHNRVLLWLPRGRVLAADPDGVAVVDVAAGDKLAPVIRAEAPRRSPSVHIGEELLHERGGLRLAPHAVRPHPPRGAVHEHDQVHRSTQGRLIGAG